MDIIAQFCRSLCFVKCVYLVFIYVKLAANYVTVSINAREHRRGNQKCTIQRNWQHRVHKTQGEEKHNKNTTQSICVGLQYTQTNTNNVYTT